MASENNSSLLSLLLVGGAVGGAIYLLNREKSKELVPSAPGGAPMDPRLTSFPGFSALPPDQQAQLDWMVKNGTKAQLLQSADFFDKAGNKPFGDLLRNIAATKAV